MISFGTDGWRGVIADDFTFNNVRIVTQAVCDYVIERRAAAPYSLLPTPDSQPSTPYSLLPTPSLVIGYDTRFLSDRFARAAAEVVAANGIKVLLSNDAAPTPAVSYAVVNMKTDGAIMFTASHNPFKYNGLKFKAPYGGSASQEITDAIEGCLERNFAAAREPMTAGFDAAAADGLIELFDAREPYLKRLAELVDTDLMKGKNLGVVVDPMFGAGSGYLSEFLRRAGCNVLEIRAGRDPYFGGGLPEPLGKHLKELTQAVTGECPVGIALDGDADRLGAIDQNGDFINSHMIMAMLLRYLHKEKGMTGEVVKTVSTTRIIDLMAKEYGIKVHETPIGFKYICDRMLSENIMIGGEESGGIGVKGHVPERDGMLIGALLVEMMCFYGNTLAKLWAELETEYGTFCYDRNDIEVDTAAMDAIITVLGTFEPSEISGIGVERLNKADGYKYCLVDNSWLMFRASGTEPVVRIYAEAASAERVQELLRFGRKLVLEAS